MAADPDGAATAAASRAAADGAPRWRVVIVDEERQLDERLRALLVHALPALAERLASRAASVDGASERGER